MLGRVRCLVISRTVCAFHLCTFAKTSRTHHSFTSFTSFLGFVHSDLSSCALHWENRSRFDSILLIELPDRIFRKPSVQEILNMRAFAVVLACLVALAAAVPEHMMEDRIMRRECVRVARLCAHSRWTARLDQLTDLDFKI